MLTLIILLSGCAGPPTYVQPFPSSAKNKDFAIARSSLLDYTDHRVRHIDTDKNVVYSQDFGGGGAALALLIGPLGAVANVKMIEANTDRDVALLKGKIPVDPVEVFRKTAKKEKFRLLESAEGNAIRISPWIFLVKTQEDHISLAAALMVENDLSRVEWTGQYLYQLPLGYSVAELANPTKSVAADIESTLATGYVELLKMLETERAGAALSEKDIAFKSTFVNPRYNFELLGRLVSETSDRVCIRTYNAVYSLPKSTVTIKARNL